MAFPNYGYPFMGNYSPVQPFVSQGSNYPPVAQTVQNQQPSAQQAAIQGLSPASRPVTNKEEANAVSADFSGALMVFPDITHNRIYVKRWDYNSGSAVFLEYVPATETPKQEVAPAFATQDDIQAVNETVNALRAEIEKLKKGRKKNESDDE